MNSKLIRYPFKSYKEFLEIRKGLDGFGGSDVSTILGLNEWKPVTQFFYEKVGIWPSVFKQTAPSYRGRKFEDVVAIEYWRYYDPNSPGMDVLILNEENGSVIRTPRKINAIISNPKYPWLFTTMDRLIDKKYNGREGALEIKTASSFAHKKWKTVMDPGYIMQHQEQLLVSELPWGEVGLLIDGTNFECYPFENNEGIQENILIQTKAFYDNVGEAKKLVSRYHTEIDKMQAIAHLEPAQEKTPAYLDFIKEAYRPTGEIPVEGDIDMLEIAEQYITARDIEKEGKRLKCIYEIDIRTLLRDHNTREINFGAKGKMYLQTDNKINVKIKKNEEAPAD